MRATAGLDLIALALLLWLPACGEEAPRPAAGDTAEKPAMKKPAAAKPKKMPEVVWRYWVFGPDGRQGEPQVMTPETKEIRVGDLVVRVGPETRERRKPGRQELTFVLRELTCDQAEISVRGTRFGGNRFGFSLNDDHTSGIYGLTTFDFRSPGTDEKLGSIMTMTEAK
jgi:hypothetical protein